MLTYAVDDKISFRNLKMWQNEFLYYADVKENAHFPFIVVGNKVMLCCFLLRSIYCANNCATLELALKIISKFMVLLVNCVNHCILYSL